MIIKVHMLAFQDRGMIREVDIPDDEIDSLQDDGSNHMEILELVFKYGQNDFQPRPCPSVSVGDVAQIDGKYYACCGTGWRSVPELEFNEMSGNRSLTEMGMGRRYENTH